jgi:hypothetical protein
MDGFIGGIRRRRMGGVKQRLCSNLPEILLASNVLNGLPSVNSGPEFVEREQLERFEPQAR